MTHSASPFVFWLLQQKLRNNGDIVGKLSRDVSKDPTFPLTADRLWLFLHYYRLDPSNRESVKKAHREWRKLQIRMKELL